MKPLTIDEATDSELPDTLEVLIQSVLEDYRDDDDKTKTNHLFVVLLFTLMMECGFSPTETFDQPDQCAYLPSFDVRRLRSVQRMPRQWWSPQENTYKLKFHLSSVHNCSCLLTVMPLKHTTIVNAVVPGETKLDRLISFQNVCRYVKSALGDFADLRSLSHEFKDNAAVPIRSRLLADRGLTNAHLACLPVEILLSVGGFLDCKSLGYLLQTCHRLSEVCRDDSLWKPISLLLFGAEVANDTYRTFNTNWHGVFSSLMIMSIAEKRRNQRRFDHDACFEFPQPYIFKLN